MAKQYDRSAEDLGNIVGLEHVNLLVPDQGLATLFYISGLGLTRDPYLMTSVDNMWVNVGRSQFHLPTGKAQKLRGRTALVIPGRDLLLKRLENMKKPLGGTQFSFKEHKDHVTAICPWGNEYVVYEPSKSFAGMVLGMPYVEFDVPTEDRQGHRRLLQQGPRHHDLGEGPRRARLGRLRPGAGLPRDRQAQSRTMTAITSRSMSRTSPSRITSWSSARSSPRRATSTSTASTTSSIRRPARSCSRSSTRSAASPIRSMRGRW